jgi:phage terminase large subunit GpA-like protein
MCHTIINVYVECSHIEEFLAPCNLKKGEAGHEMTKQDRAMKCLCPHCFGELVINEDGKAPVEGSKAWWRLS